MKSLDEKTSLDDAQRELFSSALDLLAAKLSVDERRIGVEFPHVTNPDGSWETHPASWSAGYDGDAWNHGNWTCGYWVGLLFAAYLRTAEIQFLQWARERMRLVEQRADDPNTHDIGFIFDSSAVPGWHVTAEPWYADIAVRAAGRLRARLVSTQSGAYLSAWGPLSDPRGRSSSAIDTMGNLSLLYFAARHTGDESFRLAAQAHADKTAESFVRDNDSTYHAVEYDPVGGRKIRGYTFQGYNDESTWPRGQAWAIYGYVNTARESGARRYLDLAERLALLYVERSGRGRVPPWDFDDPENPNRLEDSAAAAIAAAAFVELAAIHPEANAAETWHSHALSILETLCTRYLARKEQHRGLLMHGCYSKPHNHAVDGATMFGDFYFVEALCKLVMPGKFRPHSTPLVA